MADYAPKNTDSSISGASDFGASKGGGQDGYTKNPVPLSNGGLPSNTPYNDFLKMAQENFNVGKNYFDIAVRRRVEDNLAHAYSRHASGSKFYSPEYDKRSKIFRPKTRAMLRKLEAACAIAFFSTRDIIDAAPNDENDINNVLAADVHKELLNERLKTTIPWFKICMGAFHDAATTGVVISCQEWQYAEATITEDEYGDDGEMTGNTNETPVVLKDTPGCRLIPVENLLLHPSTDWCDPVNSSPYIIEMIPWFIPDLVERIKNARSYGSQVPYLRDFTESDLMAGMSEQSTSAMSVRMAREHSRLDRYSQVQQGSKFRPVWVHRNIVRIGGLDWCYETLGTTMMLSEPVPIEDVFGRRTRPYKMGSVAIEPHRLYPSGPVEMVKGLQEGINDVTNQRRDNVALVLNNRFLVKRGQMVDSRSLMRNVPGSITMTTDPTGDVKQLETKDVTSSSYQEQDRFNAEFDEIAGQLSGMTMGAMKMGQDTPVGTTELLGNNADIITELSLQTFCITWANAVLNDFVELERIFESDQSILARVSNRAKTQDWMHAFRALEQPVNVTVSVGFGSTDPMKQLQKLQLGFQILQGIAPDVVQQVDKREITHEVFGRLGFKDGTRFFPGLADDKTSPKEKQLQDQITQLQQQLQEAQGGITVAKIKAESSEKIAQIKAEAQQNVAVARMDMDKYKANLQGQLKRVDQQIAEEANTVKKANLLLEREALSHAIMESDRAFALQVATTPAVAPEAQAEVPGEPAEAALAGELLSPGSDSVVSGMEDAGANPGKTMNLPGNDAAGVIQRGDFGKIPGAKG
jgi:hypothetical protein